MAGDGASAAVPVSVTVRLDDDAGRTDRGTPFRAAGARAEIRAGRAVVVVAARPSAAQDAAARHAAVRDDLLRRVSRAIAW